MSDNKCSCIGGRDSACISTSQILDSCKDKDCYEDSRVYLTPYGQELIEHTSAVRATGAEICRACVSVSPVMFSRGFYQVTARYYVKVNFEACVGRCSPQCFDGITVVEKKVVLYGGEGNVRIFRSKDSGYCCNESATDCGSNVPEAVIETVEPVVLTAKVIEPKYCHHTLCCCPCCEIPDSVSALCGGSLTDPDGQNILTVSLGMFSVIRIERPASLLISATPYAVPDKECPMQIEEEDACAVFKKMDFPTFEFEHCRGGKSDKPSCGCK